MSQWMKPVTRLQTSVRTFNCFIALLALLCGLHSTPATPWEVSKTFLKTFCVYLKLLIFPERSSSPRLLFSTETIEEFKVCVINIDDPVSGAGDR